MIVQEYNKANIDVNNNDNGCEGVLFFINRTMLLDAHMKATI